ncbi:MAG: sugar phosphate isomerase/epimerase family protein [Solirubrobacteraceae bacterium]
MSLRFGYVTNGLVGHRLQDALRLLADTGYDGVALTLDHVHFDPDAPLMSSRAATLRALLDELGLACVVETGARFALDPRRKHFPTLLSEGRGRRVRMLSRAIDVAAELGAPVVSLWSGAAPSNLAPAVAWERLLEGMDRVLTHAERRGVRVGFEPEPGMFVERLGDFEALDRRLGGPEALGITLDIGHCVCLEPEPVPDCIRRAAPRLVHVHIEDMRRGVHEHLMFGDGELDLAVALAALQEIGYGGMTAVELSRHAHAAHETVPRAIALLRGREREEVTT